MADEHPEPARANDQAETPAATTAASPSAPEATQPEFAEGVPGFREALLEVLKVFVPTKNGFYLTDRDSMLTVFSKHRRRQMSRITALDVLAVTTYCDAVGGRQNASQARKELLDRLEGTVAQKIEFDQRRKAEEIAHELGVSADEVLAEAASIAGRPN